MPFKKFSDDNRGTFAVSLGLGIAVLLVSAGGAVDFSRWLNAKTETASALDAAVLAGARTLLYTGDETLAIAAAQDHYDENVVNRLNVINNTINFAVVDNGTAISGSGNADIKTGLLELAGIDTLPIIPFAGAGFPKASVYGGGGSDVEVSLMLDMTGSMCSGSSSCVNGSKIDALKTAAKNLVDIVVRDDQSSNKSRVALVPFSERIRLAPDGSGAAIMKALTNLDATWNGWYLDCTSSSGSGGNEGGGNWQCDNYEVQQKTSWMIRPCVTDRFYDSSGEIDYTDDAPGSGRWLNAHSGTRMPMSRDSSDTAATTDLGLTSSDPASHYNYSGSGTCSSVAIANVIEPLSSDKDALKAKIDSFEAYGSTGGAMGTAWAWYMISPKWASIWPSSSAPANYSQLTDIQSNGQPKLRKVAVLMSDGVYNTYRGWDGQDKTEVANSAKTVCENMKAAGIEIYTVGFELDNLSSSDQAIAEDTLRSCGTDVNHFYNTLGPEELKIAFRDIAAQLSTIVLMK